MDFTVTGEKLASVGQAPDFMLTVWDWKYEKVILHCKAFGQDVAKVYTYVPSIGIVFHVDVPLMCARFRWAGTLGKVVERSTANVYFV